MTIGYLPVYQGQHLEKIFEEGVIRPAGLNALLDKESEQEARRGFHRAREIVDGKIDRLEAIAFAHPELFAGFRSNGLTSTREIAFYAAAHLHDDESKRLFHSFALQGYYLLLYSSLDAAASQISHDRSAVLEVRLPAGSKCEQLEGIGRVYVLSDEIPSTEIRRVHAKSVDVARKILTENGSNAELKQLAGAKSAL